MNKLLYFGAGAGVGFLAGIIVSSIYSKKTESFEVIEEEPEEEPEERAEVNPIKDDMVDREYGPLSPDMRQEIRERLHKNYIGTTNYATKFGSLTNDELNEIEAEKLFPTEDDDNEEEIISEMMNRPIETSKDPEIVSYSVASELPNYYENSTLFLYLQDEVLVDETDNVILDPVSLIGDINMIINEYENSDESIVFVQNHEINTVYEVQIIDKAWYDVPHD